MTKTAQNTPQEHTIRRRLTGIIVSNKMQKTVLVEVGRFKTHRKYRKAFRVSRRFQAHDAKGEHKVGDKVVIEATRPLSKMKRWRVVGKA